MWEGKVGKVKHQRAWVFSGFLLEVQDDNLSFAWDATSRNCALPTSPIARGSKCPGAWHALKIWFH